MGTVKGEHARVVGAAHRDATDLAIASDGKLAFFPVSSFELVRLAIDAASSSVTPKTLHVVNRPDVDVNVALVRLSPQGQWLLAATRQQVFIGSATSVPYYTTDWLVLSRSDFPRPECFSFEVDERRLFYTADGIGAVWDLGQHQHRYQYEQLQMHLKSSFFTEIRGKMPYVITGAGDSPLLLDARYLSRPDVLDPLLAPNLASASIKSWLLPSASGQPADKAWVSPDGKRFLELSDAKVRVDDIAGFTRLPAQSTPDPPRDYRAFALEPRWSADGRWCLLADETNGRVGAVSLETCNPCPKTVDLWGPQAQDRRPDPKDVNAGHFPLWHLSLSRENRVAALWMIAGGLVTSTCRLETRGDTPIVSDLRSRFVPVSFGGWLSDDPPGLHVVDPAPGLDAIPSEGKSQIVLAEIGGVLHFRIFDQDGKRIVDTDETRLEGKARQIESLRLQVQNRDPSASFTGDAYVSTLCAVESIVNPTPSVPRNAEWTLFETSGAYLISPGWSILRRDATGIEPLPEDCRLPAVTGANKAKGDRMISCARSGYFIPACVVDTPRTPGGRAVIEGLVWETVWKVDESGRVRRVWKSPQPIVSRQLEFSADGHSIWHVNPEHFVERIAVRGGAGDVVRQSVWRAPHEPATAWLPQKLLVSPGEKWVAWQAPRSKEIRLVAVDGRPREVGEHVFSPQDFGLSEGHVFFVNDEMLVVHGSFIRLGATLDEASCVRLGGLIKGTSRDGHRLAVARASRIAPELSRGGQTGGSIPAVYSSNLPELLKTARRLTGRPPNTEESMLLRRSQRHPAVPPSPDR
jgi:hypothetical protein